MEPLFHLSIPVDDLDRAKAFYVDMLGCALGRKAGGRFDIDFFGHHVVAHLAPAEAGRVNDTIDSDGDMAPSRHFGVILPPKRMEGNGATADHPAGRIRLAATAVLQG